MDKKYIIPIMGVLVLSLLVVVFSMNTVPVSVTSDGIHYTASVCIYKNGELVECNHNVLTGAGENMTRDGLGVGGTAPVLNITLCNATDAATTKGVCGGPTYGGAETFTTYALCGLEEAGGTYTDYGVEGNWSVSNTFTSSCAALVTNVTRLGNGSDIFASNKFTAVTLQSSDTLTVNWTIGVS